MTQPLLPSLVPTVVDALVALAKAALPTKQVIDGPAWSQMAPDVVLIATDQPAVIETQNRRGMGHSRHCVMSVVCGVSSSSGNVEMKPRRDTCAAMLTALRNAILADPTLDGLVETTQLGPSLEWRTQQDNGAICDVIFEVTVQATI